MVHKLTAIICLLCLLMVVPTWADNVQRVPSVTGLTVNQALEEIAKEKYAASVEYEYATVAPGVVIAQTPDGGILAPSGQEVRLIVSKGLKLVELPNLIGLSGADAIDKVKSLGLRIGSITEVQTGDRFVVKDQDPAEGSLTVEGDVVNLTVGIPKLVRVPALIGLTLENAQNAITSAGLKVGQITRTATSNTQVEIVKAQSPRSGVFRYEGTVINIEVWSPK
ncbi:PASTA domain-containing protein [Coprothermobacter platensis]|uniref:PASTA domain-containing protein n=1 Tax=Coprothermobacter platensis TaxID=108819 RepID=UPI000365A679|nr:PASTA domain-containing protein [Coprothermobacter platensis]